MHMNKFFSIRRPCNNKLSDITGTLWDHFGIAVGSLQNHVRGVRNVFVIDCLIDFVVFGTDSSLIQFNLSLKVD